MPVATGFRNGGAVMALTFMLGGCEPPRVAVVPEGLTSDRQVPARPWGPELHPLPGGSGRASYVDRVTLGSAVGRVLAFNPAIKVAFLEIEAKHGEG